MTLITHYSSPITAFVALGSNLGDPPRQVRLALGEIAAIPQLRLVRGSSLYRSPPEGKLDQPDFVNAVARIETRIAPLELLDQLLMIERAHGRARDYPNAPRTLDLDILLFGGLVLNEPRLTIPHPRMLGRAFVLVPLAEIAPEAVVPGHGRIGDLARKVDASGMVKLAGA